MKRSLSRKTYRLLTYAIAGILTLLLSFGMHRPLSAQMAQIAQIPLPSPSVLQSDGPPAGVQRYGAIEVAPVTLEGNALFRVVASTVRDRSQSGNQIPVEVRVEAIEANLRRVIALEQPGEVQAERGYATNFDPATLQIFPTRLQDQPVIVAKDAYRSQPLELVTVTKLDADYYGVTTDELAQRWQAILYKKLFQELKERLPERLEERLQQAVVIVFLTLIGSALLWRLQRFLDQRYQILNDEQLAEQTRSDVTSSAATVPGQTNSQPSMATHRTELLGTFRRQFTLTRRRSLINAFRWLVGWGQIVAWLSALALILNLFPETRPIGTVLLGAPINLLLIWLGAGLLNWLGDLLIARFSRVWEGDQFSGFLFAFEDAQRKTLRIATTARALRGLKTFLVYFFAIAWSLQTVGVPITSVLAGGAIVAFAISLGFQNLVRDLVNGCLILWEDQYGIGDVISIDGTAGFVENMNLRVTQLRDAEGRLITIPNSSISKVENLTRTWSRIDFSIEIDYDSDVEQALEVMGQVARQMYEEPEWHDRMIDAPEVLGIDQLSHLGILIRIWIKTKPLQQWPVSREFRRRIRRALQENHIRIGTPQQSIRHENAFFPSDRKNHDGYSESTQKDALN